MFTKNNTYNEVVNSELSEEFSMLIGKLMFSDETILSFVPEEAHDKTFQEIEETVSCPWGGPFPSQEMVDAANLAEEIFVEKKWKLYGLWNENQAPIFDNTKNDVCLFTPAASYGEKRPAVVICPGGAYETLAMVGEGFGIAEEYEKKGYRPYILRYRRKPSSFPAPQEDLTLAILYVMANAERDGIDPKDLTIVGFSAGGHLCSSTVAHIEEFKKIVLVELGDSERADLYRELDPMPGKMVLGYGVTDYSEYLFNGLVNPEDSDYYLPYKHVTDKFPKTYAFACEDDELVPYQHTVLLGDALKEAGVESMYHIYPTGGHGISKGNGTSAEGWLDEMWQFME